MERMHAVVEGQVQGVGFRQFAVRQARALALKGWVRNRPDGDVETVAEGPRDRLIAYLGALREGPYLADVSGVRPTFSEATGEFNGFDVRW